MCKGLPKEFHSLVHCSGSRSKIYPREGKGEREKERERVLSADARSSTRTAVWSHSVCLRGQRRGSRGSNESVRSCN